MVVDYIKTKYNQSQIDNIISFASGALAGLIADVVTFPIDTMRARQQVSSKIKFNISLLRGIGIVSLVTIPEHALYFFLYENLVNNFQPDKDRNSKSPSAYFMAGLIAEVVDVVLFNPVDVIKQKIQISSPTSNIKWYQTWNKPSDLYRGVIPNVLCHGPYLGIHWALYEPLKRYLSPEELKNDPPANAILSASIFASAIAAALTNPLDVVRTRVQTAPHQVTSRIVLEKMIKKEGIKSFGLGLVSRVLYLSPATALLICVYEFTKEFLTRELYWEKKNI